MLTRAQLSDQISDLVSSPSQCSVTDFPGLPDFQSFPGFPGFEVTRSPVRPFNQVTFESPSIIEQTFLLTGNVATVKKTAANSAFYWKQRRLNSKVSKAQV